MEVNAKTRQERLRERCVAALNNRSRQLLTDFRLVARAVGYPGVPWFAKLLCGCAVLYVVSPIQLIPNFIPILGQLDDVLVVGLALRVLKKYIQPVSLDACLNGPDSFRIHPQQETTMP